MKTTKSIYLALLTVLLSPMAANADIIYDEDVDGDASGSLPGVDLGVLDVGTSTVIGFLPGNAEDDWFQFTIGAGTQLDNIILAAFSGPGGNFSFNPGGCFNCGPFDASQIGNDILDIVGQPTTLGAGTYSVKAGTGTNFNELYQFDFEVSGISTVPEPGTLALLGLGLVGMAARRKKKL